jgi:hypothetical protein
MNLIGVPPPLPTRLKSLEPVEGLKIKKRVVGNVKYRVAGYGISRSLYIIVAKTPSSKIVFNCLDIQWNDDFESVKMILRNILVNHYSHVNSSLIDEYRCNASFTKFEGSPEQARRDNILENLKMCRKNK